MTDEHKERIYEGVQRMVIWDEPRSDVLYRLEVDGIDPAEALRMYHQARAERIAIIRADSMKQAAFGFGLLLTGFGLLAGFFIGFGGFTRMLLAICATAVVFGTWHFSKGLFYIFFAHAKEGSLANDD
ncbi:MAG: hypothetical protein J0L73_08350 [Verrucomicrobia bacterium]|nr:hypothetical protein [Verrucomicrobiota bacterium]